MKTSATTPEEYVALFDGWRRELVDALRAGVKRAVPEFDERLKWGHCVFFLNGPALLVRVEETRVLFGFWRGQRLREIEPRLKSGGKYEMATLELREGDSIDEETIVKLAATAANLNRELGDPTKLSQIE